MELINGDCLLELKKLKDKSIDFVYLDLPYGQTACTWDKKLDHHALWVELKRIAKNDRTPFFFSCTTKFGFELYNTAPKGWFRWDLVWEKNRAAGFLNAYKLPMRKHEMVYCFAQKSPDYDVSSHLTGKTYESTKEQAEIYGKMNDVYIVKETKDPLPTSILPPQDDHELVYCFAQKTPEYDVSSHLTGEEVEKKPSENDKFLKEAGFTKGRKCHKLPHKSKVLKEPLPNSVLPPQEDHELVYCFAKKSPEYDVSSHSEYKQDKNISKGAFEVYGKELNENKCKRHKDLLPTSVLPPQYIPSSWCKYKLDEGINHRTSKPIKLMEFLLKYWSKEGDTVLDPTAGSGSMGCACINMNRKFILIEKDPDIFAIMKDRLDKHKKGEKVIIKPKKKPKKKI